MATGARYLIDQDWASAPDAALTGGKALNLWRLSNEASCRVPQWFCVTTTAFQHFVKVSLFQVTHSRAMSQSVVTSSVEALFGVHWSLSSITWCWLIAPLFSNPCIVCVGQSQLTAVGQSLTRGGCTRRSANSLHASPDSPSV